MKKTNRIVDGVIVFAAWGWRILKKGVWLLGFLPQLLDYISTYIPSRYVPVYVRGLLEKGGDWRLTLIFMVTGLLVSAFLVHLETQQALKERDLKIHEFIDEEPNVIVGFQDEIGHLVETYQIRLQPLPPKPDFDLLVENERRQLLNKPQVPCVSSNLTEVMNQTVFGITPNPNYEKEVERYLPQYHNYLVRLYEHSIANDRTRALVPIVHNKGHSPANNVTIEFAVPEAFAKLAKHQQWVPLVTDEMLEELEITKDKLAEFQESNLCDRPPRPQRFIKSPISWLGTLSPRSLMEPFQPPPQFPSEVQGLSNVSGPSDEVRDGVHYVVYRIAQLVQHQPENNLEPFYIWLGDIKYPDTWQVRIRITSADLRKPRERTLSINIEITQDAGRD